MLDVYANFTDCDDDAQEILGDLLEMRASNPKQRQIYDNYLSAISILPGARVMEVGCGTGPICRALARWHGVEEGIRIKLADALEAEACRWVSANEFRGAITYISLIARKEADAFVANSAA